MIERKLASIQKVVSVKPVENSDNLDVVGVLGWKVVTKRNEFKVGDLVVYIEIDSILPELPEFEFMRERKFIVKTARLRGQLSQGIVFNLNILPKICGLHEGMNVTDVIGVNKYAPLIPFDMVGESKGYHPSIVSKTGEMRAQSNPRLLEEFRGLLVAETTKIEGTSSSYIMFNGNYDVCSHTHSMIDTPKCLQWRMSRKYKIEEILKGKNLSIQGEVAGPGIYGNPMGLDEMRMFVFRITDLDTGKRFTPREIIDFCEENGLDCVPMKLDVLFDFKDMDEVIASAEGIYETSGNPREGVVYVPMELTYSETLCDWLSMKVINNTYLLGTWKKNRKK